LLVSPLALGMHEERNETEGRTNAAVPRHRGGVRGMAAAESQQRETKHGENGGPSRTHRLVSFPSARVLEAGRQNRKFPWVIGTRSSPGCSALELTER